LTHEETIIHICFELHWYLTNILDINFPWMKKRRMSRVRRKCAMCLVIANSSFVNAFRQTVSFSAGFYNYYIDSLFMKTGKRNVNSKKLPTKFKGKMFGFFKVSGMQNLPQQTLVHYYWYYFFRSLKCSGASNCLHSCWYTYFIWWNYELFLTCLWTIIFYESGCPLCHH